MKWTRPYLDFVFDLGFFSIRTSVWRVRYESRRMDWIFLETRLFKWCWVFSLYSIPR